VSVFFLVEFFLLQEKDPYQVLVQALSLSGLRRLAHGLLNPHQNLKQVCCFGRAL
jgi:hypothetical protein